MVALEITGKMDPKQGFDRIGAISVPLSTDYIKIVVRMTKSEVAGPSKICLLNSTPLQNLKKEDVGLANSARDNIFP